MPIFKEEEIKPVTTDIDLEVQSFTVKKQHDTKRYIPDNIQTTETVLSLNFHPTKKLVALGCVDGETSIYEYSLNGNRQVATFQQHLDSCREVCFSDNGKCTLWFFLCAVVILSLKIVWLTFSLFCCCCHCWCVNLVCKYDHPSS